MSDDDRIDPSARFASNEIEVPGTPEEVWEAIATGPGHAAWIFPADIEPEDGGAMVIRRHPYGEDVDATVTAWTPPERFEYDEPIGVDAKPLTTEILVQAKDGGHCVVRVVCGFRDHGEDWEDLVEGAGEGWRMSLTVLRAYLTHFAGQRAVQLDASAPLRVPEPERRQSSAVLFDVLGLSGLAAGEDFRTPAGTPALEGTVEHLDPGYVLLRVTQPYAALYAISCFPMADGAPLSANVMARLYGTPSDVARREQAIWRAWLADLSSIFEQ
ncbi:Uncharacterized conserved protein YndB, AHSA1/START domain [Actinopolymorpha cephalotaxi]|uniref:Uncharacterized conserved protein YndB, AHSA1/START domain n=1 Tax=Actinopolymorpha cephalotaxi TaxID=504797 RepID=A0A1I2XBV5_9ACTN|nr:SRPBCC domain-containing protein [Actinopolymorpha cephalotaxi]NYH86169.1 uncharacterized protein YndB with AHSA1/START domain [Actinopolymorpha cephalotaxi]SFH10965.1 Uncharacterized conserved protein YndB, AHSA1/START domain [Actinopolymorpha cephalotaxi]